MDETGLVNVTTKRNNSLYHITDAGKNTLEFFGNKISDADPDRYSQLPGGTQDRDP